MKKENFGWHIVKLLLFFTVAFLLGFPLSDYVYSIVYPFLVGLEPVFHAKFTEGSLYEFTKFLVYLVSAYFIFSLCYFIENMVFWIIHKSTGWQE